MANENGEWIMHGLPWDNPLRIRTWQELINYINEVGFLPLFKNEVEGFSAEEHTSDLFWWSGDPEQDPWYWREIIARSGQVAYGKFFNKKAGFISLEWLPVFANYRRDGYDYDAAWDDGLLNVRAKKIMDLFEDHEELAGHEIRKLAGFGKGGEKNFSGVITDLQMQTYLVMTDFRLRKNKKGQEYGWPVAVYRKPESVWGYEAAAGCYSEDPKVSKERIVNRMKAIFPEAGEKEILKVIR